MRPRPKPGVCYAAPASGVALSTKFTLLCESWSAESALAYSFGIQSAANPNQVGRGAACLVLQQTTASIHT